MKVIVCGGRKYEHKARVFTVLDAIHAETPITILMHGNARGADGWADDWGADHSSEVQVARFPADWEKHELAAGPLRNQEMLDAAPDLVVAFPGGNGTDDMVRRAKAANVKVIEVPE